MGEMIDPVLDKWRAGDRQGALAEISDELITSLIIVGDLDDCRERLEEYRTAGVRVPCIAPFSGAQDSRASVLRAMRELAPR